MIVGDPTGVIMIQINQNYLDGFDNDTFPSGLSNFIINGKFYPGAGCFDTLYNYIGVLPELYESGLKQLKYDIGKTPLSEIDFFYEADDALEAMPQILIDLSTGLYDYGFGCYLGFDGDEERFIFTNDWFETVEEIRLPKGTMGDLFLSLPDVKDLVVELIGNHCQVTNIKK